MKVTRRTAFLVVASLFVVAAVAVTLVLALTPSKEDRARDYCHTHAPIALQDQCVAHRISE